MNKQLLRYYARYVMLAGCFIGLMNKSDAQTNTDGLMIPQNYFCTGAMYGNNSWRDYWEGTFKRDNGNLGLVTTNTYSVFANYGILNSLDILVTVPYVTTNASQGTLKGQKGFQDIMASVKWRPLNLRVGKGVLSAYATALATVPLSNYEPNFLPVSIGLHSNSASLRGLVNYQTGRLFAAGSYQYTLRGNVTLDQDAYYTTEEIYSNKVYMPNVANYLFSAGYRSTHLNVEAVFSQTNTLGGFDIRKNDMPFPSNKMNWTTAGGLVKYSFNSVAGLEITAGGNYVLSGRNIGQSTTVYGGALYLFNLSKHKKS